MRTAAAVVEHGSTNRSSLTIVVNRQISYCTVKLIFVL
jgi:hypothetical protein